MKKDDLIGRISKQTGMTKKDTETTVNSFLEVVTGALKSGNEISFPGFGKFFTSRSQARTGRNPRTGDAIQIPASTQPKFKAGKNLKDAVNG